MNRDNLRERWMEYALGVLAVLGFLIVWGFVGWIEGGCNGSC